MPFRHLIFLLGTHASVSLGCSSILDQLYTRALSVPVSVVTVQLMGQQYYVKEKASPKVTLAWLSFTLSLWCNVNSVPLRIGLEGSVIPDVLWTEVQCVPTRAFLATGVGLRLPRWDV